MHPRTNDRTRTTMDREPFPERRGCPVAGKSLGECAALEFVKKGPYGDDIYEAYIYLWDDSFSDWAQIAQWFLDAGAKNTIVTWVMHDHTNGDRNGRTEDDGSRAVIVCYALPAGS